MNPMIPVLAATLSFGAPHVSGSVTTVPLVIDSTEDWRGIHNTVRYDGTVHLVSATPGLAATTVHPDAEVLTASGAGYCWADLFYVVPVDAVCGPTLAGSVLELTFSGSGSAWLSPSVPGDGTVSPAVRSCDNSHDLPFVYGQRTIAIGAQPTGTKHSTWGRLKAHYQ